MNEGNEENRKNSENEFTQSDIFSHALLKKTNIPEPADIPNRNRPLL